jgi:hypothetical protein
MIGGKGTSTVFFEKFSEGAIPGSANVLWGWGVVHMYYITICFVWLRSVTFCDAL